LPQASAILVAQPDRNWQRVQDRLVFAALFGLGIFFLQPDRRMPPRASARRQEPAMAVMHLELERHAAVRQAVERGGERQRIGALEARLQKLVAATIREGSRPSRPHTNKRRAPRPAARRVRPARLGLGAHHPQRTAQPARGALLRQRPQPAQSPVPPAASQC